MRIRRLIVHAIRAVVSGAITSFSAPASAQYVSTAPEAEESGALWLDGGGAYLPSMRGSIDLHKDASNTGEISTNPEIDFHFEAAVWGTAGNEPMAFAHASMALRTAGDATYLAPPPPPSTTWGGGYGQIPCSQATDIHCACGTFDMIHCNRRTFASGVIAKPYRFVNTSGTALPGSVILIPVLIDYVVHRHVAMDHPLPGQPDLFGFLAQIKLSYTTGVTVYSRSAVCTSSKCTTLEQDPAPTEGTFRADVEVAHADDVQLSVEATINTVLSPECILVNTSQGDLCLVPPHDGRASLLADPYVYIDPSWEYASWFEVQTTADQDNTTWVAAKRTSVDLAAFGIGADGGSTDGGVPDAGQGADAAVDLDAGMDSGVQGMNNGGGCSAAAGQQSPFGSEALFLLMCALALARRRETPASQ